MTCIQVKPRIILEFQSILIVFAHIRKKKRHMAEWLPWKYCLLCIHKSSRGADYFIFFFPCASISHAGILYSVYRWWNTSFKSVSCNVITNNTRSVRTHNKKKPHQGQGIHAIKRKDCYCWRPRCSLLYQIHLLLNSICPVITVSHTPNKTALCWWFLLTIFCGCEG